MYTFYTMIMCTDHIELIHEGIIDVHMHNINDYHDPLSLSIIS